MNNSKTSSILTDIRDGILNTSIERNMMVNIQSGSIPGWKIWTAFGERDNLSTATSGNDLWRGNELSTVGDDLIPIPPDAGDLMTIVSEHVDDNGSGVTGILTVKIEYIDPAGGEQVTEVTLNGTTPVNISIILMRHVQYMYATSVGSNSVAEGHIALYKTGDVNQIYCMIPAGGNMSVQNNRMVPLGKKLYLQGWNATNAHTIRSTIRLRSTDQDGVLQPRLFTFKDTVFIKESTTGHLPHFDVIPALSIVKISGWVILANAEASGSWWGILIDD